jgi:hypothetical protein
MTVTINGTTGVFTPGATLGTTVLLSAGAGTITFPAATGTLMLSAVNYTWPGADGTNGQVLTTNGAGVLSWSSAGGGSGTVNSGTSGQLAYYSATGTAVSGTAAGTGVITALGNAAGAANGFALLNGTGVLPVAQGGVGGAVNAGWTSILGAAPGTGVGTALGLGINTAGGALVPSAAGTAGQVLLGAGSGTSPTWSATPTLGVAGTTAGTLGLSGATSGTITLQTPATAGTNTLTLPAATTTLLGLTDFTGTNQSLVANGYQKLPGGTIIQWGSVNSSSGGAATLTFPIAFPTACRSVIMTAFYGSGLPLVFQTESALTTTSTTIGAWVVNAGSVTRTGQTAYYVAIGY